MQCKDLKGIQITIQIDSLFSAVSLIRNVMYYMLHEIPFYACHYSVKQFNASRIVCPHFSTLQLYNPAEMLFM